MCVCMCVHVYVCVIFHTGWSGEEYLNRNLKAMRSEPSRDLGMSIPGKEISKCKAPKAGMSLVFSRNNRDFPGSPVGKTPCFHCRVMGSITGQGTKIPHTTQCGPPKNETTKVLRALSDGESGRRGGQRSGGDRGRRCRALWATVRTWVFTLPKARSHGRVLRSRGI